MVRLAEASEEVGEGHVLSAEVVQPVSDKTAVLDCVVLIGRSYACVYKEGARSGDDNLVSSFRQAVLF